MTSTPRTAATAEIIARLEQLASRLEAITEELKTVRIAQAGEHATFRMRADENARRITEHGSEIESLRTDTKALQREIDRLCQTVKMLVGIVAFIGVTAGGWMLSNLLGLIAP
jgi:chromosome segregation ATPase